MISAVRTIPTGAISRHRTSPALPEQGQESTITATSAEANAAWGLKDDMFPGQTAYIVVHVRRQGVQIEIEHPLHGGWVHFTARSHRPFTREGIIAEAKSYIDSHILLAPGRYRDLQLEHMVSKEQFPAWYRQYKMRLHDRAEAEHRDMVDRYRHRNDLTYGEARDMLAASGIFFDLNCDEFERDEITEQFVRLCNKT